MTRTSVTRVAAGIHCIEVPTPFAVGSVNAYLIDDDPLTLVDTGPASTHALLAVQHALHDLGCRLEDVRLVLVTHQHIDHLGLVGYLAEVAGAEIVCLDRLASYAACFEESAAADGVFTAELMRLHGVPADTIAVSQRAAALTRSWGGSFVAGRAVTSGSVIELHSRSFRVLHAPGHSPTDTLFHDETNGVLVAGDHLLPKISSNALVSALADGDQARRRPLREYIDSLLATRELDLELVLPGHGPPVSDHRRLIDDRLAMYRRRANEIVRIVAERPRTAHQIAQAIWGSIATTDAFLTLSEVLGHLDLALTDDEVVEDNDEAGLVVYRRA